MQAKGSLSRIAFTFPFALVALLISSPTGAQTQYPVHIVTPNYVEGDTLIPINSFQDGPDDGWVEVALPFPFTFYGVPYNHAFVSTNGYINFLEPSSFFYNDGSCPIFGPGVPNGAIFAFWDDLLVDDPTADVWTRLLGTAPNRQFVIEWRNVFLTATGPSIRVNFEIVLSETGVITLQYRNTGPDALQRGSSATIGLVSPTGEFVAQFSCLTESLPSGQDYAVQFGESTKTVAADIKPGRCPNRFEVDSKGALPVAVLGMDGFDVTTIDPTSVTLAGVAPLRWSLEDDGTPYEPFVGRTDPNQCTAQGPDGFLDMAFKFDSQKVAAALGTVDDGEVRVLQLRGKLRNGTEISGEDVVTIIEKDSKKGHKRGYRKGHGKEHKKGYEKEHYRGHKKEHEKVHWKGYEDEHENGHGKEK